MSGTLNLPQGQIDTLLERFPAILTEAERALPEPQRNAKALARISHMIKTNEKNKANLAQQNGQVRPPNGGGGGPSQVRPPPQNGNTNAQAGGSGTMQSGQQGQINQGQHAGQVGQSPKMVMYNGGMVMPQAGQQMNASQQQAYQEQMRLQQQHQQQSHITDGMSKNQRAQQQAAQQAQAQVLASQQQQQQQQQQQNSMMPPQPSGTNMTAPSPQQQHHPTLGSPHANAQNMGRSPSQVPSRQAPTPVPDNMGTQNNVKTLMDSFPKLLELRRQGLLLPDQEKHLNNLMASEAGRAHFNQVRAQQANSLIQNVLSNPVGQHQSQIPPQLQQQLNHQQQQQLAAQMAQQQHQQMGLQGFPQGMMHNQQHQPQTQEQQLAQQQLQQMQMRQLQQQQQQQQQGIRPPTAAQAQVMARVQAQQAQNQILQAAQQMGHASQQNQQLQQQHIIDQQGAAANFGSPRPPQQAQQRAQALGPERAMQIKNTLIRLQNMNDAQREAQFQQNPADRNVWIAAHKSNQANQLNQLNLANQQNLQAQMMQNAHANSPANAIQVRPIAANNANAGPGFAMANNMPNLHIPANKQRNSLSQGQQQGGSPAAGTPPMRPPMPLANPSQQAQIQRMLNQGIPVNMPGGVRPPMGANQAQQAGQKIEPFMIVNQINKQQFPQQQQQQQQQQAAGEAPGPIRRMSEQPPLPLDRSGSLLSRVTWAPSPEYDSALREKLSDFRRPIKPSNRPTLSHGFGVSRVIGDVILERMPEGLSAIAEDADGILAGDKKKGEEGSGMPGQKKRKVAELAETVDKHLEVDRDVETCILQLADEHVELIANLGCMLAKHRKSDTVDRKDIQLAYEMMEGRNIPGFSSDSIRLDQARSIRRAAAPLGQARLNKLKLVQDAKVAWRKEKATKLEEQKQGIEDGDDEDMGDGTGDVDLPPSAAAAAPPPEVMEVDFGVDPTPAISLAQPSAGVASFGTPAKIAMPLEAAPMGIVA